MDQTEFRRFVDGHRARHPHAKLPAFEENTVYYQSWFKALLGAGVNSVDALEQASMRLLTDPAKSVAGHFPTLRRYAQDAMRLRGGVVSHDLSTREGAEHASKGCDRCGGGGLAIVYHPWPDREARIAPTSAAYCVCALGRWIEQAHRSRSPDIRRRMPDLKDAIEGRSEWLSAPASEPAWA